ncbi:MAG: S41 family peptidase [Lachnospiraceae bacterium]
MNEHLAEEQKKKFLSGFISGILLMALLFGAIYIGKQIYVLYLYKQASVSTESKQEAVTGIDTNRKMQIIENTIDQYYLDEVEPEKLQDGIYYGMVEALDDPYSTYYSAEDLVKMQQETQGIYYGIGAYVGMDKDTGLCTISGVIEETPAQEAGLRTGDVIYKVDGVSTQGMETTDVVALIKGEENTTVHLTIARENENDFLELDVVRRKIENPTVNYEMKENGIAYIQITEFDEVTTDQFTEALAVCKGSDMKGLILDLRSNPGGNLNVVCEIARKLLPKGMIVYTEDKYGQREEYTCDGTNQITVPMVVLVNGYSASASEILSGAIKDYGIGTLMGTKTFGKGIVQRIIPLSDGSALKLTVSKYYTPNGKNIHGVGIEPDEVVEFDAEAYYDKGIDNQLDAAVEFLKEKIK